ncbi:MAG: SDR family oxidoreductase [Desulfobacteraceae bacterium]|nr:SDR family oxidoreductase [Desulfobacteraceae bacterium]
MPTSRSQVVRPAATSKAPRQRGITSRQGKKRILVTGGAGFIGCHLCERLLAQGHEVVCLDDFSTGSFENIAHLMAHPRFHLREHDIGEPLELAVEQIYNLACPASPIHYQTDPVRTTRTSVLGALNMLELAKNLRVPVLQASTSEVYGDPDVHPQPEEYCGKVNPVGPRACYDEGKRCAETIFFDYRRQYGLEIKVCRIFNTYGPRMHVNDGRVVSNFLVQALQDKPLTVYGTGEQTRSFCYVDDMVDALIKLMWTPSGFTGPINLGNPVEFTILALIELVRQVTGSGSEIAFCPLPEDDPRQRRPDITLAKEVLHWAPRVTLREGLTLTAAYFHEKLRKGSQIKRRQTAVAAGEAAAAGPAAWVDHAS